MNPYSDQILIKPKYQRLLILFIIYLAYLFILTLSPFEFSSSHFKKMSSFDLQILLGFLFHFKIPDIIVNILLFIPIGGFLASWSRKKGTSSGVKVILVSIFFGSLVSLLIEITQLFLDRSSTIIDVLSNVCGSVLGAAGLWQWFLDHGLSRIGKWLKNNQIWRPVTVFIYLMGLGCLMILPVRMNHFGNWDDAYYLLIGNEATGNRPWQGRIDQLVIYQRALPDAEIRDLFHSGLLESETRKRHNLGSVLHYRLGRSKGDTIRNLVSNSGSLLVKEQAVKSIQPVRALTQRIRNTSQFTVELWMQADRLDQAGPARIVTLSQNTSLRNFTLGQQGQHIHFRVRTPLAGLNGSDINLAARLALHDTEMHHLVATYHYGVAKLFVDGEAQKDVLRSNWDHLPFLLHLGRHAIGQVVLCFILFFPLSLLLYRSFRKQPILWTVILTVVVLFAVELSYFILFKQPFTPLIIITSIIVAGLGACTGWFWKMGNEKKEHGNKITG